MKKSEIFTTHGGAVKHKVRVTKKGKFRVLTFCHEFGSRWALQRDEEGKVLEWDFAASAIGHMLAISKKENDSLW